MDNFKSGLNRAIRYSGKNKTQIAKEFNISPQALDSRLNKNNFSFSELSNYAEIIGAEFIAYFQFQDGTKI